MAGETVKSEAICLSVRPWSRTSHVVAWLTPAGRVTTVVKGAVRPKSAFLGQYDLNYTCEIVYYARAKGEVHALRECVPLTLRERLRSDYRALVLADYCRALVERLAPQGPDCLAWFALLTKALDAGRSDIAALVAFERRVLGLMGLEPEIAAGTDGGLCLRGEREIPVSPAVAAFLENPLLPVADAQIPLDAARVIGVFYNFHVDLPSDVRRSVLSVISRTTKQR